MGMAEAIKILRKNYEVQMSIISFSKFLGFPSGDTGESFKGR
jgi:hypothetical protein